MMNVKEIIIDYLKSHGYDGLCNDDCGCGIDNIAPCDECFLSCVPAYHVFDINGNLGNSRYSPTLQYVRIDKKLHSCPKCKSNNIKCRGIIYNCEDCGERWQHGLRKIIK